MAKWVIGDKEFESRYRAAVRAGQKAAATEPRARAARYVRSSGKLAIDLTNEASVSIPVNLLQGLGDAAPRQLAAVEVVGGGFALHWEELDCDFTVPGLVAGLFGTQTWMTALGRAAGKVKSPAKARAARENGKKGGRPAISHKKWLSHAA
jgi:hypothetical protein